MQVKKVEVRESNLKELFDEFKFHLIYRHKQTKVAQPPNDSFKDLLAQLRSENRAKRSKVRTLRQSESKGQSQSNLRPSTSLQHRIWEPRAICESDLDELKENLLLVQREKEGLNAQIGNLQYSLVELKKSVSSLRRKVQLEGGKAQKYKHISYLSNSIQRNTDTVKILNSRSYKSMLKHQEQTLTNLKRFKTTLRKENEELENKFMQSQKHSNCGPRKAALSQKADPEELPHIKIDRKFMNVLEELLHLFIDKEARFQEIKSEQTTKVRLKKVQKQYLKEDRVRWHEMIEKLEDRHDVKMESLANLILFIYRRLTEESQEMENECIQRNQIKTLMIEDLENLKKKENLLAQSGTPEVKDPVVDCEGKKQQIFRNSRVLVKLAMMFHSLIGKFKYLFTMAITLSKEKKNFHELLVQIGHMYNPNHILLDCLEEGVGNIESAVTSFKEIEDMISEQSEQVMELSKDELLSFLFSDIRYTLIFRTIDLQEQLKEGIQRGTILEKIQAIQNRCEQTYFTKVKVYSKLLVNCLKSLAMNKYQKKMVANSKAKESLFMSIPKSINIVNMDQPDEGQDLNAYKMVKTKFNSEDSQPEPKQFAFVGDPRRIVRMLEQVKNEERQRFRPLNLNTDQVYMYDRKVVIPKYIL